MKSKTYTREEIETLTYDELKQIVSKSTDKEEILSLVEKAPINKQGSIICLASMNKYTPIEALKHWRKNATDFDTYNLTNQAICERTNIPCRYGDDDDPDPYPGWQSMMNK